MQIETGAFEFRDPKLERSAGLTAADRKWMDDILTDVNDSWNTDSTTRTAGMQQFKGSDDYLRSKVCDFTLLHDVFSQQSSFAVRGICFGGPVICEVPGLHIQGREWRCYDYWRKW